MSGTLSLGLPGNRREVVKTNPSMLLSAVLAEACARGPRPLGDPAGYALQSGKATLDLSLSLRFAGLPNGARLEVVPRAGGSGAAPAAPRRAAPAPAAAPPPPSAAAVPAQPPPVAAGEPLSEQLAAALAAAAQLCGRAVRVHSREALQRSAAAEAPLPEPDDSFFEFDASDLAAAAAEARRKAEGEVLQTRAMREAAAARRAAQFARSLVRLDFPDGLVLEASFAPTEPLAALRALLRSAVEPSAAACAYLFTAPPKAKLGGVGGWEQSVYAAGLVPAALVHVGMEGVLASVWPMGQPLLRAELRAIADALPPQRPNEGAAVAAAAAVEAAPGVGGGEGAGGGAAPPPPREGVRPPGELREKLAAGQKPKWLKL